MRRGQPEVGDVVWYWELDDNNKPRPSPAMVTDVEQDGRLSLFVMFSQFVGLGGGGSRSLGHVQRAPRGLDIIVYDDMPNDIVPCWTRKPTNL